MPVGNTTNPSPGPRRLMQAPAVLPHSRQKSTKDPGRLMKTKRRPERKPALRCLRPFVVMEARTPNLTRGPRCQQTACNCPCDAEYSPPLSTLDNE